MTVGIYGRMNANDPSFIHFPHIRTGDREGIFDTDFSIKKEGDCWHLSFEHVQDDSINLDFHFDDFYIEGDFFDRYSKKEFLNLVEHCCGDIEKNVKIPARLSELLDENGETTEWKSWSSREIESKEYFLNRKYSRNFFKHEMLPLVNSISQTLNVDLLRKVEVNSFFCFPNRIGFVKKDDGFFVYRTDENAHIDVYGKFDQTGLIVCLAFLLDARDFIEENRLSDSILKKKKHFKSELAAEKYLGVEE
ncbi:MAG: hypothetical protein IJ207_02775 [Treponema sp.]|uniref:hypothetical protein n=1 Tax=Treponema sp. TaxID=166 RepID=UPI0025D63F35|nr:hypothetical protein [Treponema sp.]MBQ9281104.1 hypothetical protein [Treponema sp.]MBR1721423.1 hypothetical protein [Treponema sp.]